MGEPDHAAGDKSGHGAEEALPLVESNTHQELAVERATRKRQHVQDFVETQAAMLKELRTLSDNVATLCTEMRASREAAAVHEVGPPLVGHPASGWSQKHQDFRKQRLQKHLRHLLSRLAFDGDGWITREALEDSLETQEAEFLERDMQLPPCLVVEIFDTVSSYAGNGRASVDDLVEGLLELNAHSSLRGRREELAFQDHRRTTAALERAFPQPKEPIKPLRPYLPGEIPEVEVAVKVNHLSNVDTSSMTFKVDFLCFLDWIDDRIPADVEPEDLRWGELFFYPEVKLENVGPDGDWVHDDDALDDVHFKAPANDKEREWCRKRGNTKRWCSRTLRFRGEMLIPEVDLRAFPFDFQLLPLRLKFQRVRLRNIREVVRLVRAEVRCYSSEYRSGMHLRSDGCLCPRSADCMLEFNLHGIMGYPVLGYSCRGDVYQVGIIVKRPVGFDWYHNNHLGDFVILFGLAMLSACSFWDESPDLSSSMSITLTIILTFAAYTSSRPPAVEKVPYNTFQDYFEYFCMALVLICVAPLNMASVVMCGGENEESPRFMQLRYDFYRDTWCAEYDPFGMRKIQFVGLIIMVSSLLLGIVLLNWQVSVTRWAAIHQRVLNELSDLENCRVKGDTSCNIGGFSEEVHDEEALKTRVRRVFSDMEDERRRFDRKCKGKPSRRQALVDCCCATRRVPARNQIWPR